MKMRTRPATGTRNSMVAPGSPSPSLSRTAGWVASPGNIPWAATGSYPMASTPRSAV